MKRSWRILCDFAPLRETSSPLVAIGFAASLLLSASNGAEVSSLEEVKQKTQTQLEEIAGHVQGVMGIVVEDLSGEHRFAVNENRGFAQASAIKIPILMELLKQAHEDKVDLEQMLWVEKKNQVAGSGILSEVGDRTTQMSVEDLAVLMVVLSDNTATNMIIDLVDKENVTATMKSLGCEHTRLQRRMLDTAAAARGEDNLSTPADAAKILRLLHEGKFINREVSDHALAILRKEKPGDVKSGLPPGVPVAFKAGAVPGVTTEWAIVEFKGRPYVVVAMGGFGLGDEFRAAIRSVAKTSHHFFARISTATKHGAYIDSEQWKQR